MIRLTDFAGVALLLIAATACSSPSTMIAPPVGDDVVIAGTYTTARYLNAASVSLTGCTELYAGLNGFPLGTIINTACLELPPGSITLLAREDTDPLRDWQVNTAGAPNHNDCGGPNFNPALIGGGDITGNRIDGKLILQYGGNGSEPALGGFPVDFDIRIVTGGFVNNAGEIVFRITELIHEGVPGTRGTCGLVPPLDYALSP